MARVLTIVRTVVLRFSAVVFVVRAFPLEAATYLGSQPSSLPASEPRFLLEPGPPPSLRMGIFTP